jgi:hypothetical protein
MTEENTSNHLDPCPDEEDLRSYANGKPTDARFRRVVGYHLEVCGTCRDQVKRIRTDGASTDEVIKRYAERFKRRQEELVVKRWQGPRPGDVWQTVPKSDEELCGPMVFVIEKLPEGDILVAEVSERIEQAIESDVVLWSQETGLSFRCMVRAGNTFRTSSEKLKSFVCEFNPLLARKVTEFCTSAQSIDDGVPFSRYLFGVDANGTKLMRRKGITSGMLVTQDADPRAASLKSARERCSYLRPKKRPGWLKKLVPLAAMIAVIVITGKSLQIFMQDEATLSPGRNEVETGKKRSPGVRSPSQNPLRNVAMSGHPILAGRSRSKSSGSREMPSSSLHRIEERLMAVKPDKGDEGSKFVEKPDDANLPDRTTEMNSRVSPYYMFPGSFLLDASEPRKGREGKSSGRTTEKDSLLSPAPLPAHKLLMAVKSGKEDEALAALDRGADVHFYEDRTKATSLHWASYKGYSRMIKLLLENGADTTDKDIDGLTALDMAILKGHHSVAGLLRGHLAVNRQDITQKEVDESGYKLAKLLELAGKRDPKSQYELGKLYEHNRGITRDLRQATGWYKKAAEQGYAPAQYSLGLMYLEGRGVPRDKSAAIKWLTKAAEKGFDEAKSQLSVIGVGSSRQTTQ